MVTDPHGSAFSSRSGLAPPRFVRRDRAERLARSLGPRTGPGGGLPAPASLCYTFPMRRSNWALALLPLWALAGPASILGSDSSSSSAATQGSPLDHAGEIRRWREDRLARLTSETGWLSLVGLHWLSPGKNTFGSDPTTAIPLRSVTVQPVAGSFVLNGKEVRVAAGPDSGVTIDGAPAGERLLKTDADGAPDELRVGPLHLVVVRRGDRFGVRVKDPWSAARTGFRGLDYFPISSDYRVEASFVPYAAPKEVQIPTVLGTNEIMHAPGLLKFRLLGRELSLEPVLERPDATELFVIFRDRTSGVDTHDAGRFLYTDLPKDGRVVLDFNKAYNPPCAFTRYATCPLPPRKNSLPVRIEAGEKKYDSGDAPPRK